MSAAFGPSVRIANPPAEQFMSSRHVLGPNDEWYQRPAVPMEICKLHVDATATQEAQ